MASPSLAPRAPQPFPAQPRVGRVPPRPALGSLAGLGARPAGRGAELSSRARRVREPAPQPRAGFARRAGPGGLAVGAAVAGIGAEPSALRGGEA